jgi:hypothetical protein
MLLLAPSTTKRVKELLFPGGDHMVALVKITIKNGSVTNDELLRYLPDENPEEYFEALAKILAPEDWENVENL